MPMDYTGKVKAEDVRLGGLYLVKISEKVVPVRILAVIPGGAGWEGVNTITGRDVKIRSAHVLREEVKE
jgi:hypothetical protein